MSELSAKPEARDMKLAPTLERVMGIEPTRPAWKAGILPLNYTRKRCLSKCQLEYVTTNAAACQSLQIKKRIFRKTARKNLP